MQPNDFTSKSSSFAQFLRACLNVEVVSDITELYELEQRVFYDASPLGVILNDLVGDSVDAEQIEVVLDEPLQPVTTEDYGYAPDLEQLEGSVDEIVFIDRNVENYSLLIHDLTSQSDIAVYLLDSNTDGVVQISQALQKYSQISAVHIVSHGDQGSFQVGSSTVSLDNFHLFSEQFAQWGNVLSADADLLIYGCNVAGSDDGKALIETIETLTGADVAASVDLTGQNLIGGDWELEAAVGIVETDIAFSTNVQQVWQGVLATINGSAGSDILEGTNSGDTINGNGGNDILLGGTDILSVGNLNSSSTLTENGVTGANSGWTINGSVDFLGTDSALARPNDPNDSGIRGVDLNTGGIETSLAGLSIGETYSVAFFMGADGAVTQTVDVEAVGLGAQSMSVTMPGGNTLSNMDWQAKVYTFTATSTSHTLRFTSTSGSVTDGAIISGVRVVSNSVSDGADTIYGGAGVDLILGGGGADSIYADDDNEVDIVDGGDGADNYYIDANNTPDSYQDSGATGTDTVWGQTAGTSTYFLTDNFSKATSGIDRIYDQYSTSYTTYLGSSTHATALNWDLTGIDLQYIEYIRGGTQDDIITVDDTGTEMVSYIYGYGGNDTITDGADDMIIYGGTGNDTINTGEGSNTVYGEAGDDIITGGSGNDTLRGGDDDDTINAGDGINTVYGDDGIDDITTGSGNDTIYGGADNDTINSGAGNDTIQGGFGADVINAGAGNDTIASSEAEDSAVDIIDGGDGADNFYIHNANNTADTYQDSGTDSAIDTLWFYTPGGTFYISDNFSKASTGVDRIYDAYGASYTTYIGSSSYANAVNWDLSGIDLLYVEYIRGGTQDDIITVDDTGTEMVSYIYGYGGNDTITDGADDMIIYGGTGNDTINTGEGSNTVYGEAGDDIITGGSGNDTLRGGDDDDTINAGDGTNTVYGDDGIDDITTGSGNDTIYGGADNDTINSGAGNDTIQGGLGADVINAGAGNDTIASSEAEDSAVDIIDGGDGADNFYIHNSNNTADTYQDSGTDAAIDTLWFYTPGGTFYISDNFSKASTGVDRIYDAYGASYTTYIGSSSYANAVNWDLSGIDLLYVEYIRGGTQDDTITIDDDGTGQTNFLYGYAGNDVISDGAGDHYLYGGNDDDTLYGGAGTDYLYGDAGTDTARYDGNYADYNINRASYTGNNNSGYLRVQETTINGINEGNDVVYGTVETLEFNDGSYDTASAAFTLFRAIDDAYATHEGAVLNVSAASGLLSNDDSGTSPFVASISTTSIQGIVTFNADGSFTYDPNGQFNSLAYGQSATDTFEYTYDDGTGATDTGSVTITIRGDAEPLDLSSGIELNNDGGNDAYLQAADGGAILGGLGELTIETTFQIDSVSGTFTPLVSYAVPGFANELTLQIKNDGNLLFTAHAASGAFTTTTPQLQLLDGEVHHVAASWDNTNGTLSFYVDGELIESTTGYKTGIVLTGGGTLVLGQEQESVGGGYQSAQNFRGTLYDIRIWNEARSTAEIAANHDHKLDTGSLPSSLIANWQMDGFNGSNQVVDAVSGNNLSIGHASGTGFTTSAPIVDLTIEENSANGTHVGFIEPTDSDLSGSIAAIVADNPSLTYDATTGKFYKVVTTTETWNTAQTNSGNDLLHGLGGQLVNIRSAYENGVVHGLISSLGASYYIGATDANSEGAWNWFDEGAEADNFWNGGTGGSAPSGAYANFNTGEPNNIGNEDYGTIRSSDGKWNDDTASFPLGYIVEWDAAEVLDNVNTYAFSLTDDANGRFAINSATGEITVADGSQLDYEIATSHNVTVQATDATGDTYSEVMSIAVSDIPAEATQVVPVGQTTAEDTAIVFNVANGNAITVSDSTGADASMQVALSVANGQLNLSGLTGITIIDGGNGASSLVIEGLESDLNVALEGLTYTPNADDNGADSLSVTTQLVTDARARLR